MTERDIANYLPQITKLTKSVETLTRRVLSDHDCTQQWDSALSCVAESTALRQALRDRGLGPELDKILDKE